MHLLNPQVRKIFIHTHVSFAIITKPKEKTSQHFGISYFSKDSLVQTTTAAARQFLPCPTPANAKPDYLYRKTFTLPQKFSKLQLLPENMKTESVANNRRAAREDQAALPWGLGDTPNLPMLPNASRCSSCWQKCNFRASLESNSLNSKLAPETQFARLLQSGVITCILVVQSPRFGRKLYYCHKTISDLN